MDINNAYDIVVNKLAHWVRELIRLLPNIALASVILVIGFLIAKWSRKLSGKILRRFIHNETLDHLLATIIYIFVVGITIFAALSVLQLDKAVTSILAGAGIAGLALAFAFQDIAANFMSGIFLFVRKPLHVGDIVKAKDYMGKITDINLRDTVGVSYGDDLQRVKDITLRAVQGIEHLTDDEVTMFFEEFGDSSINFVIRLWVNTPEQIQYLQVRSDAVMRIKKAYDDNNITIPFPIRTLDFGIKGGLRYDELKMKSE